jgi:hypothetical protein
MPRKGRKQDDLDNGTWILNLEHGMSGHCTKQDHLNHCCIRFSNINLKLQLYKRQDGLGKGYLIQGHTLSCTVERKKVHMRQELLLL